MSDSKEDRDFREHVVEKLGKLETGQENIVSTLTEIKDDLSGLSDRVMATEQNLILHAAKCPIREMVVSLEKDVVSGRHPGSKDISDRVSKLEGLATSLVTYKRLAWVVVILVIFLTLIHAAEVVKAGFLAGI